jgi:hypothetical protein
MHSYGAGAGVAVVDVGEVAAAAPSLIEEGESMDLPYDPDDPPATAPDNAHPTLWGLAYLVHVEHQAGTDGWCATCRTPREFWPCPPFRQAQRGMVLAATYARQLAGSNESI